MKVQRSNHPLMEELVLCLTNEEEDDTQGESTQTRDERDAYVVHTCLQAITLS